MASRIGRLGSGYPRVFGGKAAPTVLHTDDGGLVVGEVWVPVEDGEIPAYRARPAGAGPHPVLLVVQEVFGVDEYLMDVCRRVAQAGYLALAPELYARQGEPGLAESRESLFKIVLSAPDAQVLSDLDACATFAAEREGGDAGRLAITGFCWGGRVTWLYAAHRDGLRAGVAWYGRLSGDTSANQPRHPLDVAGELRAPVLGLYGGDDAGIPPDQVEQMKDALRAAGSPSEFVVYPGAPHAFHADYRDSYRPQPAADGWQRMLDWLQRQGV